MDTQCRTYQVLTPSRKDKTLVAILDKLKQLETKVDRIPTNRPPILSGFGPLQSSPSSQPSFGAENDPGNMLPFSFRRSPSGTSGRIQQYRHASAAHKMLLWPALQQIFPTLQSNIGGFAILEQEDSAFVVEVEKGRPRLPLDDALQQRPFVGVKSQVTRATGGARITFPSMTRERMLRLTTAYFDTFNFLYPFMDRQIFVFDTLFKVDSEGFNGDTDSVIALLVFSLGEVAIDGSRGQPISVYKGRPSGIRGGSAIKPPGLGLFNEAMKGIGFVMTGCELESVQIFSLVAYVRPCILLQHA